MVFILKVIVKVLVIVSQFKFRFSLILSCFLAVSVSPKIKAHFSLSSVWLLICVCTWIHLTHSTQSAPRTVTLP